MKKNLKILLNINISLFFTLNAYSQVNITITYPKDNKVTPDLLWDFCLNNPSRLTYNAIINYELKSKEQDIDLQSNSTVYSISPGTLNITPQSINNNVVYDYSNPENKVILNPKSPLIPGEYILCIKIIQVPDQITIGENCIEFKITPPDSGANSPKKINNQKRKWNFNLSGNSEIYGYHSSFHNDSIYSPSDIITWTFNPVLEIFGLPIGMNMNLTNDKNPLIKSANSVNFYFDSDKYFDNLKKSAIKSINTGKGLSLNENSINDNTLKEYKNIDKTLNNPQVIDDLNKIEKVKKLESKLNDSSIIHNTTKYDSLKNEYNSYSDIIKKRKGYERLIEKKSGLEKKYKDTCDKDVKLLKKYKLEDLTSDKLNAQLTDSLLKANPKKYDSTENAIKKYEKSSKNLKEYGDLISDCKKYDVKSVEDQLTDSLFTNDIDKYDSIYRNVKQYKSKYEKISKYENIINNSSDYQSLVKDTNLKKLSAVNLNYDKYKDFDINKLDDPQVLTKNLTELGLVKKYQLFLIPIKKFSIGSNIPYFTDLILANTQIKGTCVELEYKKVYLAFSNGTLTNNFIGNVSSVYKRKLTGISLGYGNKNSSHFVLYYLSSKDDSSQPNVSDTSYSFESPKKNNVIGSGLLITTYNKNITFEGEIEGSYLKSYNPVYPTLYDSLSNIISRPTFWFFEVLTQKTHEYNVTVDYAYKVKLVFQLFKKKAQLSGGVKRIGPDYISFGVPYLINDLKTYEVRYTQGFLKRKIILSTYLTEKRDNLQDFKPLTTSALKLGFDASINFPRYPYLRINITPFALRNDSMNYYVNLYSFTAGYSYKIKKWRNQTSISYISQQIVSTIDEAGFSNDIINLSHNSNYRSKIGASINLGYITSHMSDSLAKNYSCDIATTLPITKKIGATIGLSYFSGLKESKIGFTGEIRYTLNKYLTFNIRAERRSYDNYIMSNNNPENKVLFIRSSLITKW